MTWSLPSPTAEPRIGTTEVCAIAKLSRITIQRRIKNDRFPAPIDRGTEQLFDRRAVYEALGIAMEGSNHAPTETEDPWVRAAHALAEHKTTPIRRAQKARRGHLFLLPGSKTA